MAEVGVSDPSATEVKAEATAPSPEQMDTKEVPESQDTAAPSSAGDAAAKDWKAWSTEETKTMIDLYKTYSRKYPEYSRKLLWQEISQGLKKCGYVKGPERIRNRMKSLRTTFRRVSAYNASHILKKDFAYLEELQDVYGSGNGSDDNSSNSGQPGQEDESNSSYGIAGDGSNPTKKIRLVRLAKMPKVDPDEGYETPIVNHSRTNASAIKRKVVSTRKTVYPLYQCGLCSGKFSTSQEMHAHRCQGEKQVVVNGNVSKKKPVVSTSQSENGKTPFLWNGMSTLKFLELLKEFKIYSRNPSSKNGNILDELSLIMRKEGIDVSPEDLEKKWKNLASTYEKTVVYNKKHQDKKKCAFFNRLNELYKHGASLDMFRQDEPVKMTVEVSPFSFTSSSGWYGMPNAAEYDDGDASFVGGGGKMPPPPHASYEKINGPTSSGSELVQWLDSFWKEWKDLERRREVASARRHNEMMEVLSFIAENLAK